MWRSYRKKTHVLGMVLLSLGLPQCLKAPLPNRESRGAAFQQETVATVVDADGVTTGEVTALTNTTQVLAAAADSSLSGTSVSFPPGSLAISGISSLKISMQEGSQLASSFAAQEMGLSANFTSTGTSVVIMPSVSMNATTPFTIAIPRPAASHLALADQDNDRLVVIYKTYDADAQKYYSGMILPKDLVVDATTGFVKLKTKNFGSFQSAYVDIPVTEAVRVESSTTIQTKVQEKSLPALTLQDVSSRKLKPGEELVVAFANLRPTFSLWRDAMVVSNLRMTDTGKVSLTIPADAAPGAMTLHAKQESVDIPIDLTIIDTTTTGISTSPSISTSTSTSTNTSSVPEITNLLVSATTMTSLTLTWSTTTTGTYSYLVAIQSGSTPPPDCTAGVSYASSPATLSGLTAATSYSVRVCVVANAVTSPGAVKTAGTQSASLPDPTGVSSLVLDGSKVRLTWIAQAPYTLIANSVGTLGSCSGGSSIPTTAGQTASFDVVGLTPNTNYNFLVCSYDGTNMSPGVALANLTAPLICNSGDLNTACMITTDQTIMPGSNITGSGDLIIGSTGVLRSPPGQWFSIHMNSLMMNTGGFIRGNLLEGFFATTVVINAGAGIDVTGLGSPGGLSPGEAGYPQTGIGGGGMGGGGGGAGIGEGGMGPNMALGGHRTTFRFLSQPPSGAITPLEVGAGGGFGSSSGLGGNGGGAVNLKAGNSISLSGNIIADGSSGGSSFGGGGGGGGSVWLNAPNLSGTGTVTAKGGMGGSNGGGGGGGGGGGLIWTYFTAGSPAIAYTTQGGSGGSPSPTALNHGAAGAVLFGEVGTINRRLIINNGGLVTTNVTPINLAEGITVDSFEISGGANAWPTYDMVAQAQNLLINSLTLDASSTISANGKGGPGGDYGTATNALGIAAGQNSLSSGIGGGGGNYAGAGGKGYGSSGSGDGAGGFAVGWQAATNIPAGGSGGGYSVASRGGNGGGILSLSVTNNMSLLGYVTANGANGGDSPGSSASAGGGSGGYIRLSAGGTIDLGTSGHIAATGGLGGSMYEGGGGGGGGYVKLSAANFTCSPGSATISAQGGDGGPASNGSTYDGYPGDGGKIALIMGGTPMGSPPNYCAVNYTSGTNRRADAGVSGSLSTDGSL